MPLTMVTISRTKQYSLLAASLAVGFVAAELCPAGGPGLEGRVEVHPEKVVGVESCQKCHANEIKSWQQTPHFHTFRELHRKPEANEIAKRLGLSSIKRGDVCINCHYTQQGHPGAVKAISGVSCESCHGAAKDWLTVHSDYGGENVTKEQESAQHRVARLRQSIAGGMRNPVNLYLVARSCFNCHTVPNEQLVNKGGHKAGTEEFELVAWSQGKVRHNFLRTNGNSNAESSPDRLRVMYVVGIMTDLEYSLRATALATEKASYGVTCAKRANKVQKRLAQIQTVIQNEYVKTALDATAAVKLKLNNRAALEAAANQVGAAALQFADKVDGSSLQGVDSYLPAPSQYK